MKDYYHRCPIKNLSPEGPSDLTTVEEMLLFSKVAAALKKRGWKPDWLTIDRKKHVLNIDHRSITRNQAIDFYDEIFQDISKDVLIQDEETKKVIRELVALSEREITKGEETE